MTVGLIRNPAVPLETAGPRPAPAPSGEDEDGVEPGLPGAA
jgi:hypothetical protein